MTTLVTGSIAYDTIMVFPDRFRNHLLPDQLHILNVCFLTPQMRREFGGTAGNIGYNLKLLGDDPLLMATVGDDIAPYLSRFTQLGISHKHLKQIGGELRIPSGRAQRSSLTWSVSSHAPGSRSSIERRQAADHRGVKAVIAAGNDTAADLNDYPFDIFEDFSAHRKNSTRQEKNWI